MNPKSVATARTARLVREANKPVYSTDSHRAEQRRLAKEMSHILWADEFAGEEFCHVCGRVTDHRGEHSDEQLLAFYHGKGRMFRH